MKEDTIDDKSIYFIIKGEVELFYEFYLND